MTLLGRGYQEVDLAGATLVPGFVDAHCHPLMLGQTATWVDVSPARAPDIPALVKLLRQQAALLPPGEPLRAYGYNHRASPNGVIPPPWIWTGPPPTARST